MVIEFLASKARRSRAAAFGQVDKIGLKREEVRGNGKADKASRERRPPRARSGSSPREWAGAPPRSRPERRCDGRARSRSGNRREPARELREHSPGRPPRERVRPSKRTEAGGGARQTAPPEGGSQKRRAARPRVAEPAPTACPSGPLRLASDARQSKSPWSHHRQSTIHYNTTTALRSPLPVVDYIKL